MRCNDRPDLSLYAERMRRLAARADAVSGPRRTNGIAKLSNRLAICLTYERKTSIRSFSDRQLCELNDIICVTSCMQLTYADLQ